MLAEPLLLRQLGTGSVGAVVAVVVSMLKPETGIKPSGVGEPQSSVVTVTGTV